MGTNRNRSIARRALDEVQRDIAQVYEELAPTITRLRELLRERKSVAASTRLRELHSRDDFKEGHSARSSERLTKSNADPAFRAKATAGTRRFHRKRPKTGTLHCPLSHKLPVMTADERRRYDRIRREVNRAHAIAAIVSKRRQFPSQHKEDRHDESRTQA